MTKKREPNPQPTTGTRYGPGPNAGPTIYLWPRSSDPRRQRIYDHLFDAGWRFDAQYGEFWTPENESFEARGRLETAIDCSWARIVGPSIRDDSLLPPYRRPAPIWELRFETETVR